MRRPVSQFISAEEGATALEYALIAILISTVIIAGTSVIGTRLSTLYLGVVAGNL